MGLVTAKLQETAAPVLAMSVLLLNLRKTQCAFLRLFEWMMVLVGAHVKLAIIKQRLDIPSRLYCIFDKTRIPNKYNCSRPSMQI